MLPEASDTEIRDDERGPAIRNPQPRRWYHGSPLHLDRVAAGSTVTPIVELAKAFSHKPSRVGIRIEEHDGRRVVSIDHNGIRDGFLYEVMVGDPEVDLCQHPGSRMARGEEVLATRDLPLLFIERLPVEGELSIRIEEPAEA